MADEGKGGSSRKRNADGDDRAGNQKKQNTSNLDDVTDDHGLLELFNPNFDANEKGSGDDDDEVEKDNGSSDEDVEVEESSPSDDNFFDNDEINRILVKTATGKTISLEVKGSDTIGNMKVRIQSLEGVPFDQQELIFNEMVLENMNTLANLPIKKDSTLKLMLKSRGFINITIKTPEGILINSLEVKPSDTIGDVKAKMPGTGHVLIFNENVLEDSGTLADLHIVNGSTLTHTLKSVELMKIYVNTFTGKTISLLVSPEYTVAELKWKIEFKEDIPFDEQTLIFNKMVLGDSGTLFDFQINRKSTLTLMHRSRGLMQTFIKNLPRKSTLTPMRKSRESMKIFVKTITGDTVTLKVKPSDTIGDIKAKLEDKVNIPHDEQELIFNEMVLHNSDTLVDFHINKESISTLLRISTGFMCIFIKTLTGKTITLKCRLIFAGKLLLDSPTLADYNINMGSTIHLIYRHPRGFMIFINTHIGKTFSLKVKKLDTIQDVKAKVFDKEGCPPCEVRLVFNGKFLEDGPTLADYHIHSESLLHLIPRL
ncbi:putative Ubiquitin-like domain-containing protein [Helianthus annuus]|nr:putative Ubiquitin-like domain-containing protein [Helianthus annuus]